MNCYIRYVGTIKQSMKIKRKQQHSNVFFEKIGRYVFDCSFTFDNFRLLLIFKK
jgi:hypothetical protein